MVECLVNTAVRIMENTQGFYPWNESSILSLLTIQEIAQSVALVVYSQEGLVNYNDARYIA